MSIKNFVKKRPYLFWGVKDLDKVSKDLIVENVLNYGTWEDAQKMISILGVKETAAIFNKRRKMLRNNYRPEIENYFSLYFKKYA